MIRIKKIVFVSVIFCLLFTLVCCSAKPKTEEEVKEALYEDMWYAQVVEFMGTEGTRIEGEGIVYEWTLSDGKVLTVVFEHPWCGMSVLPDEYSLKSYYITDQDK